jgi:predicted nucleotidyltransferase
MAVSQSIDSVPLAVVECIARDLNPIAIYLFGSHARGEGSPDSDWDFMVVVPESNEPPYRRAQAARKLVRHIPAPKDIMVMTASEWRRQRLVPASLASTIAAEGRLLYGRC